MENKEGFFSIFPELFKNKRLIFNLAKNDIRSRFAGSYLGIFWAFIQPVITVLVYWFVFEIGFRSGSGADYPFVLFLTAGIVPWFFFSEALNGGMSAFNDYSYLVKKVVFHIDILPCVKILSSLFVHVFFVCFAFLVGALYGFYPNINSLQIVYYILANIFFVFSLSYLLASINIFFKDLSQLVNIVVLQLGMWMTPILWDANDKLAAFPTLRKVFKLNPMYYIVDGFRDSIILREFRIIDKLTWGGYFWLVSILIFLLGQYIYRRLKPHFADIL